jgi:hypothetical protein
MAVHGVCPAFTSARVSDTALTPGSMCSGCADGRRELAWRDVIAPMTKQRRVAKPSS